MAKDTKKTNTKNTKEQKYGDVVHNHDLVKRTLMVAGFPAMVREYIKNGTVCYAGFLPGFEFCEVEDIEDFGELIETLQDMLDDEVEELVVFEEQLPNIRMTKIVFIPRFCVVYALMSTLHWSLVCQF